MMRCTLYNIVERKSETDVETMTYRSTQVTNQGFPARELRPWGYNMQNVDDGYNKHGIMRRYHKDTYNYTHIVQVLRIESLILLSLERCRRAYCIVEFMSYKPLRNFGCIKILEE